MNDVIFTYSRKEAIADGMQVCVSKLYSNDCRLYKYPVYFTREVMGLLEKSVDPGGIVWDICYMSVVSPSLLKLNQATYKFSVIVQGASKEPDFIEDGLRIYNLIVQAGPTDFDE